MTTPVTFTEMLRRLLRAEGQGRAAKTVEIYGWVVLIEGAICMSMPQVVATVLGIPPLVDQGVDYFRLAGVWVAGIGLLYVLRAPQCEWLCFSTFTGQAARPAHSGRALVFGICRERAPWVGLQDLDILWTLAIWRRGFERRDRHSL
jgi:hypothetical protein